jgi:diadenylate cyclase
VDVCRLPGVPFSSPSPEFVAPTQKIQYAQPQICAILKRIKRKGESKMSVINVWLKSYLTLFLKLISSITITSVVEILILAFLVYKFLLWIKNTKAWTLLKGILMLIGCVMIVYALQMDTLIYLVNRAFDIAIIAAVIIFQPELRRALEQLGEKQIFAALFPLKDMNRDVTERFSDKTVNEIVKASMEMGKVKTGALIVIEQNIRLDEYERTGIVLDSVVTSQLLINIFEHNTPLHDGAVIINGNRITAATCYLPLSDNMMLSKELGTRHRAGVGISEVSDSLTVIVSEETGSVSVAYKGELKRNITADVLREQLVLLQNKSVAPKKFKFWKGWNKDEA